MTLDGLLRDYGREIARYDGPDRRAAQWRGFIQPLRYKNKMYLQGTHTPIGTSRQGYYLYIGPAAQRLNGLGEKAFLRADGVDYQIDRAELVYYKNSPLYVWAVLREMRWEAPDDAGKLDP